MMNWDSAYTSICGMASVGGTGRMAAATARRPEPSSIRSLTAYRIIRNARAIPIEKGTGFHALLMRDIFDSVGRLWYDLQLSSVGSDRSDPLGARFAFFPVDHRVFRSVLLLGSQSMAEVKIGNTLVGDGYPCFIIAEIGINHNGDLNTRKEAH